MSEESGSAAEAVEVTETNPEISEKESGGEGSAASAQPATDEASAPVEPEDVHYQAVEKEGSVTAIWEMQGQKHLRTIDPRSIEGKQILALFETAA